MRVVRKIQSKSGASILMALAVVLVCAMVASIVLVAAAANAGKGLSSQEQTRSFYAVSSAARLLADDLKQNPPTGKTTITTKHYACIDVHPSYVHEDEKAVEVIYDAGRHYLEKPTPFVQIIEDALGVIDSTDESSSYEYDFVIQAPELDDVNAHFKMDYLYNITVELRAAPGEESFGYTLTMAIPSVKAEPKEVISRDSKGDFHMDGWEWSDGGDEYSWLEENKTPVNPTTGNREPDSNEYGHSVQQFYEVVYTRMTVSPSWGEATFSKGLEE